MKRREFIKLLPAPLALAIKGALATTLPFILGPQLQFVTSTAFGPGQIPPSLVTNGTGLVTRTFSRTGFIIGSGDVSSIVLSFFNWYIAAASGITPIANGFKVLSCAIEYNGTSAPITFSGGRTKTISPGDTDIKSDELFSSAFSLASFPQGSTGYIRMNLEYANPATDTAPNCYANNLGGTFDISYDPAIVTLTSPTDGTGVISWSGGANGVDVHVYKGFVPIVLGRFVTAGKKSFILCGDSKTLGAGDTVSAAGALGITRALYTDVTSPAGTYAGCNFGCTGAGAGDWAAISPQLLRAYFKYAKYAIEWFGTNDVGAQAASVSSVTAIHAQLRANGIKHIIRPALSPRTTSSDSFATEANQAYAANWGAGSHADDYEALLRALVASDLTYFNNGGERGVDYWKWIVTGAANYATTDGVHESPAAYELLIRNNGSIIRQAGTTTGTMKSILDALP